jgi:KDO2-lipid IV(A) lauroyltransferase
MTLPQRLARLTGAAVLMACGERLPRGAGWRVRYELLPVEPTPQAVNAAMEVMIRRLPDQYFWGYNRYKAPPRAGAPEAPGHGEPASAVDRPADTSASVRGAGMRD